MTSETYLTDTSIFIEERADYLPENDLLDSTVLGDIFDTVQKALIGRGTKLIVGPRGCGKTHMMRYASMQCRDKQSLPLAVFVSFNRYFRLEPLLKSNSNAIELFHVWVLSRILLATEEVAEQLNIKTPANYNPSFSTEQLREIITRLERGLELTAEQQQLAFGISLDAVKKLISKVSESFGRKRAVILLDDAALTLTPEFLYEFFDIVRSLKTTFISLKASVYPGTTEYGSKFHVSHEAEVVKVWLSVEDVNYQNFMDEIARKRFSDYDKIPPEISTFLKYVAFGVPRAFLTLLREYTRGGGTTTQQLLNKIVEEHKKGRLEEFSSISLKIPKLKKVIEAGSQFFAHAVDELKLANQDLNDSYEKQLLIGISSDDFENSLSERMVMLLIEAGLLYEYNAVSHGHNRVYKRYMPHLSALIEARAFSKGQKGTSIKQIVEVLGYKSAKHPLRRSINRLLGDENISLLVIDLPHCEKCNTARLNDNQRFCHNCGNELLDRSVYAECLSIQLSEVPGLTSWQKQKLATLPSVTTIGDLISKQDPGTELRKIPRVGPIRANRIQEIVHSFVEEFLS